MANQQITDLKRTHRLKFVITALKGEEEIVFEFPGVAKLNEFFRATDNVQFYGHNRDGDGYYHSKGDIEIKDLDKTWVLKAKQAEDGDDTGEG